MMCQRKFSTVHEAARLRSRGGMIGNAVSGGRMSVPRLSTLAAAIGGITMSLYATSALAEQSRSMIEEVVVTASRRAQDVTEIPYNITAVSGDQMARTRVFSLEDLARQVPNLNLNSTTNGTLAAHRPVMRGLNASRSNREGGILANEESPVAIYLGNALFGNFFPLDDVERVEVLRGPQGTLYGAGSLGGAIRIIPTEPVVGELTGSVEAAGALVAESDDYDRDFSGRVNIPLGEALALRLSGRSERRAGFIDQIGAMVREGGPVSDPVLADPNNVAGSPAVFRTVEDVNDEEADSARVALKWGPSDQLDVVAAYNYADFSGEYGPLANPSYSGGIDPLDGVTEYPALGDYEVILRARQPYDRTSHMGSLDVSYDLGFATLSSTTSYFESDGETYLDNTYGLLQLPDAFIPYYAGEPINPRFLGVNEFADDSDVFTQEIRLVSEDGEQFSYIVGAFFQREDRESVWNIYLPGTPEQTAATPGGVDVPLEQSLDMRSEFSSTDYSAYGELTWHATERLDITGGFRHFRQDSTRDIVSALPLFGVLEVAGNDIESSENYFKLNASYRFGDDDQAYATFSQGFRRAGANSWPTVGFVGENPDLLTYESDTVDNYEVGIKGYVGEVRYLADVFFVQWDKPQIGGVTPFLAWPAVFNGEEAQSKGVELELSGAITESLSFSAGYAYADAEITEDFCISASVGNGVLVPCAISAQDGDQLPGSPRHSGSANLLYERAFGANLLTVSVNANYKGSVRNDLAAPDFPNTLVSMPSFWLVNAHVGVERGPWTVSAYALNALDERAVIGLARRTGGDLVAGLEQNETINRPRTVGLSLRYEWGAE